MNSTPTMSPCLAQTRAHRATKTNRGPADFDRALTEFVPGQVGPLTDLVDLEMNRLAADALLGRCRRSRIGAWAFDQFLAPRNHHGYTLLIAARLHEIADRHGANALHAAVESVSVEAVKLVMATGDVRGGVHATDRHGRTAAQLAVHRALPAIARQCAPQQPLPDYIQRTFGITTARMLEWSDVPATAVRETIAALIAGGLNPAHDCNVHPGFLILLREFYPSLVPLLDSTAGEETKFPDINANSTPC